MDQVRSEEGLPSEESPPQLRGGRLYLVLSAAVIAMLLGSLDGTILGTAMPRIVGELGDVDLLSWVVTAYMLAIAISTPVWGKVSDMWGRKGAFMVSVAVFLLGSILSGLSQSVMELVAFRVLQGLGGGGLMVGAMAVIGTVIPLRQQGRYQGVISAVMGLAMISGPLFGGIITDRLGWRWCFYVNVPLGVAGILMMSVLRLPRQRSRARIDYGGVMLLTVAIMAAVLVTTWGGRDYSWGSPMVLTLIGVAVLAVAALLYVERRVAEPMLPLGLFASRNFSLVTVIGFLLGCVMTSGITFLPIFQQVVQGASATNSGLLLLPMFGSMVIVSAFMGRVITNTGRYKAFIVSGGVLLAVATLLLSRMTIGTAPALSAVFMAVLGAGIGLLTQTTILVSLQSADARNIGVASSTATLARTLGSSVGVAVSGTMFASGVARVPGGDSAARPDPAVLQKLPHAARTAYEHGVVDGTGRVFLLAGVLSLVAVVAALLVREVPLRASDGPQSEPADSPGTVGLDATSSDLADSGAAEPRGAEGSPRPDRRGTRTDASALD
ncbi:MDR family MFS transporter [Streptomyces chattanoogensis]|uniref:MDR family MFS transporter n=1 Tax=Streptomyces chattanoogensis TaxID=66876 RepID=UPI0036D05475